MGGCLLQTKCRLEFLHQRERKRRLHAWKPSAAAARASIEKEASLAIFQLLACVMLFPVISSLWILIIHIHHLL